MASSSSDGNATTTTTVNVPVSYPAFFPTHTSATLPENHFLAQPRPDVLEGITPDGIVDTSTLAAHDFDVDPRTGFMPPQPPLARLPLTWEPWEDSLEEAMKRKLKLGDDPMLTDAEKDNAEQWRNIIRQMPVLPTIELKKSEVLLRRAHHVLAWIMHFYINTLSPTSSIIIPKSISIPLLQVSQFLALPPLLTYSDNVLYNWRYARQPILESANEPPLSSSPNFSSFLFDIDGFAPPIPTIDNLECQTLFTGTRDEAEFYLTSARIELRGVEALALMRASMDELFVGDTLAHRRIAAYLARLAEVINELTDLLLSVREGCDPEVFYNKIRPWFKGEDSMRGGRKWVFEGIGEAGYEDLKQPTELSGPSAGQSSLVHAIDVFLGVDRLTHAAPSTTTTTNSSESSSHTSQNTQPPHDTSKPSFLSRMQSYMPRHHRAFLRHLASSTRPLRSLLESLPHTSQTSSSKGEWEEDLEDLQAMEDLREGYNASVRALRSFRDAHLRIVALYIIGPARRVEAGKRLPTPPPDGETADISDSKEKGTGGTELIPFLKGVRDRTAQAVFDEGRSHSS